MNNFYVKKDMMEIAEQEYEEHRRFVDIMYHYFGFLKHPGYSRIVVGPLYFYKGFVKPSDGEMDIFLDGRDSDESIRFTNWHESGHVLHWKKNKNFFHNRMRAETVAELSALIFLDLTEGINPESLKKYGLHNGKYYGGWISQKKKDLLIRFAKENKNLLNSLF